MSAQAIGAIHKIAFAIEANERKSPIELACAEYASRLKQTGAVCYPLRQALHQRLAVELGAIVHCRRASEIMNMFDGLERAAGVSQTEWHGVKG